MSLRLIVFFSIIGVVLLSGASIVLGNHKLDNTNRVLGTAITNENISISEIQKHNSKSDCWIAIESKVYNVTGFIPKHPGGRVIINSCGTDATKLFNSEHGMSAKKLLTQFYIGDLRE